MSLLDEKLHVLHLENELAEMRIKLYCVERDLKLKTTDLIDAEGVIDQLCELVDLKDDEIAELEQAEKEIDIFLESLFDTLETDHGLAIRFLDEDELDEHGS